MAIDLTDITRMVPRPKYDDFLLFIDISYITWYNLNYILILFIPCNATSPATS